MNTNVNGGNMHTMLRALALACAALLPLGTAAQDFPTKPTRILVPYPPGGASDVTARFIAEKLSKKWGKPVFVENKAGVNGIIGTEVIALAEPDGSTIGLVASSHVTNHALYKKVPYAMTDFVPITITAQVQLGLVVNPSVPANNVQELIKLLKAQPGKINVATSGRGSNPELWALAFEKMTGTDMQDVPYKGSGAAHPDLLGGQTQVMFDAVAAVMPHVKAGKLKLLAVGGEKRSPFLPDTPTMQEAGVPGYVNASWGAIIAPAKTPKAIVDKQNKDIVDVLNEPDTRERQAGLSAVVVANSQTDAAAFMNKETARLTKLIQDVGIQPE
jgi:tripartite-type tricarboxylate transporter receptor subunit TctC